MAGNPIEENRKLDSHLSEDGEIYRIRIYGDPVLHEKALPIEEITEEDYQIANRMLATMYSNPIGIGLAATQVGILRRLIVIDIDRDDPDNAPIVLINPEILEQEGESIIEEGCLSIPELKAEVKRPEKVIASARTLDDEEIVIEDESLLARVLQHEIDHLNGILFIDHLSRKKQKRLKAKLRQIRQEYAEISV
ncbi:TPA: peptide deformylase [Candidatus Poribacteria bacterium]|nr:peptide deformylase [Candidatus Poribacteria bacterium]HIB91512.1 peptide deformylase [Candidatus Poribacteria bacterium]HIB98213.1 peptide deformylase [Candidatus Poribacteria bacterium]HIC18816.1 peptide deformylase [Candidatus Poribacteria bacterium]HIN32029.1 peptide deformylase [Candidatus Poribacteria bacterium]